MRGLPPLLSSCSHSLWLERATLAGKKMYVQHNKQSLETLQSPSSQAISIVC